MSTNVSKQKRKDLIDKCTSLECLIVPIPYFPDICYDIILPSGVVDYYHKI